MPAVSPPLPPHAAARLQALGAQLRAHRRGLKISQTAAAEAAGMSRVTWHRIETGEPSVTMGAYLAAVLALGLELTAHNPQQRALPAPLPERIRLADYPQLRQLAWTTPGLEELSVHEALAVYERNWRHVDAASLSPAERALVQALAAAQGGRLLV